MYFGNPNCINVIKTIGNKNPSDYTDEEDFMLGIMLGYDQIKQCKRYIDRKKMLKNGEKNGKKNNKQNNKQNDK